MRYAPTPRMSAARRDQLIVGLERQVAMYREMLAVAERYEDTIEIELDAARSDA